MKKLYIITLFTLAACNTPDAAQKMKDAQQPQSVDVQHYDRAPDPGATYSASSSSTVVAPNTSAIIGK